MGEDKGQNYSISAGSGIAIEESRDVLQVEEMDDDIEEMPFSLIALICTVLYDDLQSWIIINRAVPYILICTLLLLVICTEAVSASDGCG